MQIKRNSFFSTSYLPQMYLFIYERLGFGGEGGVIGGGNGEGVVGVVMR